MYKFIPTKQTVKTVRNTLLSAATAVSLCMAPSAAATPFTGPASTTSAASQATDQDRLDWFQEAKYGLFIHWGLYAVPGGTWKEEKDHAEWIMFTADIRLTHMLPSPTISIQLNLMRAHGQNSPKTLA